jgi:hypothetical protein
MCSPSRAFESRKSDVVHYTSWPIGNSVWQPTMKATAPTMTVADIKQQVCDYYGIHVSDMRSQSRARSVARPRQVAMYLVKRLTPLSLPQIGKKFGGRDHTTVLHAIENIEKLRSTDRITKNDIETITQRLAALADRSQPVGRLVVAEVAVPQATNLQASAPGSLTPSIDDRRRACEKFRPSVFPTCLARLPTSVRLRHGLDRFAEGRGLLPSLADVLQDRSHWMEVFGRVPNVGRTTIDELSELLRAYVKIGLLNAGVKGEQAKKLSSWICQYPRSFELCDLAGDLQTFLNFEGGAANFGTNEDGTDGASGGAISDMERAHDKFHEFVFPTCFAHLPTSARLGHALKYFSAAHEPLPSLSAILKDRAHWWEVIGDAPNVGRTTIRELSVLLYDFVTRRLITAGLKRDRADKLAGWVCQYPKTSEVNDLREDLQTFLDFEGEAEREVSDEFSLVWDDYGDVAAAIERGGAPELLSFLEKSLKEREWRVLIRRFGLEGRNTETLEQIAKHYSVTRERVRQYEAKALRSCRALPLFVAFRAFLRREKPGIVATILGGAQCAFRQSALDQWRALQPMQRLTIRVCDESLENWLSVNLHSVFCGGDRIGWIATGLDEQTQRSLEAQLLSGLDSKQSLRQRVIEAVIRLTLPMTVAQVSEKLVGTPANQVKQCLVEDLGAKIDDGLIFEIADLPTVARLRMILHTAARPVRLKQISSLYYKTFGSPIAYHAVGANLARLDDVLIVERGTYCLREYLPFGRDVVEKIGAIAFAYVRGVGHYVSATVLVREVGRNLESDISKHITRYVILGICHDDSRFSVKRGLMIGLATPEFEKTFVSLNSSVLDVVAKHGPVRVGDIKKHLAHARDVLDVSIGMVLKNAKNVVLAASGLYDVIERVIGTDAEITRLSRALQISLIDHDASVPIILARLGSVGINYELPTIVSYLAKSSFADMSDGVFELSEPDELIAHYNALFNSIYATDRDPRKTRADLERTLAGDEKAALIELDYRLVMDPDTWDRALAISGDKANFLRDLLNEFES